MSDKTMLEHNSKDLMLSLTAQIAASYLGKNTLTAAEIPGLIHTIHQSLSGLDGSEGQRTTRSEPAVPVRRSIMPDYIVCLEDGIKLKMLKRHLKTAYGMTPEQYRERWSLPTDYPMVAPNYAKQRSKLAKQIGLGTSRKTKSKSG